MKFGSRRKETRDCRLRNDDMVAASGINPLPGTERNN